ncbi:unnamed protein product, partial [Notodromas monacha]
ESKKQKQPLKTESEKQWEKRDKNRRKREARQARRSDATSSGGRLVSEDESELHAALEFEEYEIPQRPDVSQLQNPFEKDPSKPDVPSPKPEIKEPQIVAAKSSTNAPSLLDDIFKSQSTLFPEPTWKSAVRVDAGFAGRVSNNPLEETVFVSEDLENVKPRLLLPAALRNTCYRTWNLKGPDHGMPLKLLIRTGDHASKMDASGETRVCIKAREEMQYAHGYEVPSWTEAAENWADVCLRPVHHSGWFGTVYSIDEKNLEQISQEGANHLVGFDPLAALACLHRLLSRFKSLDPGCYLLVPELPADPTKEPNLVHIYREHTRVIGGHQV